MFITGPSIIEWPLVSAAPEAAAGSQWEQRPSAAPSVSSPRVFGTFGTNAPTLVPGVLPPPRSKLLSREPVRISISIALPSLA